MFLPVNNVSFSNFYFFVFNQNLFDYILYSFNCRNFSRSFLGKILYPRNHWRNYEKISVTNADQVILVVEEAKKRFLTRQFPDNKFLIVSNTINLEQIDQICANFERDSRFDHHFKSA